MKYISIIAVLIVIFSSRIIAQEARDPMIPLLTIHSEDYNPSDPNKLFELYSHEIEMGDIHISKPEGYKSLYMTAGGRKDFFDKTSFPPIETSGINSIHPIGLMSPDGHAVLLFPYVALDMGTWSLRITTKRSQIEADLRSINRNLGLDVKPLVEIISLEDMSQYSNADTVAIYTLDLSPIGIDYMNKYDKCIGLYLRKYGHATLMPKIMLDEVGYANRDKYIRELLDNIRYGDEETILTKSEQELNGSDFDFTEFGRWHSYIGSPEDFLNDRKPFYEELKVRWKAENDSLNRLQY